MAGDALAPQSLGLTFSLPLPGPSSPPRAFRQPQWHPRPVPLCCVGPLRVVCWQFLGPGVVGKGSGGGAVCALAAAALRGNCPALTASSVPAGSSPVLPWHPGLAPSGLSCPQLCGPEPAAVSAFPTCASRAPNPGCSPFLLALSLNKALEGQLSRQPLTGRVHSLTRRGPGHPLTQPSLPPVEGGPVK